MLKTSLKAADKLKEALLERCKENGVGFRFQSLSPDDKINSIVIKLDKIKPDDEVMVENGVSIFTANINLSQFAGWELDYSDDPPDPGFCLKKTSENQSPE